MGGLLVISGPPGSGKSMVAAMLAARSQPSFLVEGDAFFGFIRGGIDPWLPESDDQNAIVVQAAASAAGRFAASERPTIFDGVLGPWYLDAFVAASALTELDYAVLLPPLETCLERVASRRAHAFTDQDAAAHMHREFASAPLDPRHLVDPAGSPEEIAGAVLAAQVAGSLRVASRST